MSILLGGLAGLGALLAMGGDSEMSFPILHEESSDKDDDD